MAPPALGVNAHVVPTRSPIQSAFQSNSEAAKPPDLTLSIPRNLTVELGSLAGGLKESHSAASLAGLSASSTPRLSFGKLRSPASPTSVTDLSKLLDSCLDGQPDGLLASHVVSEAVAILRSNDYGGYTVPTRGLYPYQWNWDSALVAMGWGAVDEPRAWEELRTLMGAQWADGMVPHIVFHRASPSYFPGPEIWGSVEAPRGSTGITQPPVVAIAMCHLLETAVDRGLAVSQARELFPKVLAYHRWFYSARDPLGTGLVATLHPWESGMDNSPAWDEPLARVPVDAIPPYTRRDLGHVDAAMRPRQAEYDRYLTLLYRFRAVNYDPAQLYHISPFCVTDVCTNSILHRANQDLRWLAVQLNQLDVVPEIDSWLMTGLKAFEKLWDPSAKIFRSWDQLTDEPLPAATSGGFLPLFAGVATPAQAAALADTLTRWMDAVQYGVPSLDPHDARFEPLRYWRGPTWVIVNYMITDGLRRYGYHELAERLEANTSELINTHGLYEYFDPTNGSGAGGRAFSWTAAMCLAWLDRAPSF